MVLIDVEAIFRTEAGRVLATLIRLVGDFELAEEGLQEAFAAAVAQWPSAGVPANPRPWLVRVGRNKAVDLLRRHMLLRSKQHDLEASLGTAPPAAADDDEHMFQDDVLRLIFTCCHPALSLETQIALTLRAVCGLSTEAVARAFLVSEETMAQRLVRAKKKIREAKIPYETPAPAKFEERIDGVLATVYLVFTEGYAVASGADPVREELSREAIRLARLLDTLLPKRAAIKGLLALMLLHHGRRDARARDSGDLVLLQDQDRSLWNRLLIDEGLALLEEALRMPGRPSPYAVQAAIAALHARAGHADATDWPQIVGLYEVLLRLQPSPVVELNHAVAVAMVDGPARGLSLLDALTARGSLDGYHLLPSARADLLRRLGRRADARDAYTLALRHSRMEAERRFYVTRLAEFADLPSVAE
ncbi:MAG: RNA polymerase sigma factor [Alphaproteobacteria bacterium]